MDELYIVLAQSNRNARVDLFRCYACNKILSLDLTDDVHSWLDECKRKKVPLYFPAKAEGFSTSMQHWMMCSDFSEVWIREERADHFIYIKLGPDFCMLISFAAPIDLFCAWANDELKEKIGPKYFWAVVGAILFEELHGDGFQIENFLSWASKKGLKDLIKSSHSL